jgi:hypothetical protein
MFIKSSFNQSNPKLKGSAGLKRYGMGFSHSHEWKEEYHGSFCARERKNTFQITLNQHQLYSVFEQCTGSPGGLSCDWYYSVYSHN